MEQLKDFQRHKIREKNQEINFESASVQLLKSIKLEFTNARPKRISAVASRAHDLDIKNQPHFSTFTASHIEAV
jgi:hypothetical protein